MNLHKTKVTIVKIESSFLQHLNDIVMHYIICKTWLICIVRSNTEMNTITTIAKILFYTVHNICNCIKQDQDNLTLHGKV